MKNRILSFLLFTLIGTQFTGCTSTEDSDSPSRMRHPKGEYIYRKQNETLFTLTALEKTTPKPYPWEKVQIGNHPPINKEFFRCKGSGLNPCIVIQQSGETIHCYDCGGVDKHSLPLRDNKEFVFPALIEILNHIQAKTGQRVVITCGHRCPEHNLYADSSPENQSSKHIIGAEVAFYVQGMEEQPEAIIKIIQEYYQQTPRFKDLKEYNTFKRYEKNDTNVSTPPWHNKEVFVKLFKKKEGRNFDNRHPYPYISIQIRHDRDTNEKVIYTWEKGYRNYHRY